MSFMGTSPFGNYDHTAQGAVPLGRRNTHEMEELNTTLPEPGSSHSHNDHMTGTRATSMTEVDESATHSGKEKDTQNNNDDESTSEDDEDRIEENRRASQVLALARKYTSQSHATVPEGATVFDVDENSPLNPNGPNFKARAWARAMVEELQGEGGSFRTTGVAFQNLNVFGFGSATDYQKDILNVGLGLIGQAKNLLGMGHDKRIDILRNFDGVVNKGEMLIVLGPPGSGCTTFLKTIAGEHDGIFVDDSAYFNYQGTLQMPFSLCCCCLVSLT